MQIIGKKVAGNTAYLTVKTFEAGRVSGSGNNLTTVAHHYNGAVKSASLKVPLSPAGQRQAQAAEGQGPRRLLPEEEGRGHLDGVHHRRLQVARDAAPARGGQEVPHGPLPGGARARGAQRTSARRSCSARDAIDAALLSSGVMA